YDHPDRRQWRGSEYHYPAGLHPGLTHGPALRRSMTGGGASRRRCRLLCYSGAFRFALSMTPLQSLRSRSMNAAASWGELAMISAPWVWNFLRTSSLLSTPTTSVLILAMIASGVSGGATRPNHATDVKPGNAASDMVGTSGR